MAGPLDPLISLLQKNLGGGSAAPTPTVSPWDKVAVNNQGTTPQPAVHDFRSHYQELADSGVDPLQAYQYASQEHGQPPVDLYLKHLINQVTENPSLKGAESKVRYNLLRPLAEVGIGVGLTGKNLLTGAQTDFDPQTDPYVQTHPPGNHPERTYLDIPKTRSDDYQRNLAIFTPLAQRFLNQIPAKDLQDYTKVLKAHGHLENTEVDTRQAMIYHLVKKTGGLDTSQFYKDLEQTALTNPWVYLHGLHHALAYSDVSPDDRAIQVMAHLGATFGSDMNYTPLAKYYANVLDPQVSTQQGFSIYRPDSVWTKKMLSRYLTPQQEVANIRTHNDVMRTLGVPPPEPTPLYGTANLNFPARNDADWQSTYNAIRHQH